MSTANPATAAHELRIRLAPSAEPGATLYNAYQFLTQLSGLYAEATRHESRAHEKSVWTEMSDATLADLGDVFNVWDLVLKSERSGKGKGADDALGVVVVRACKRADYVMDKVNVWTPLVRWARLIRLCEARWQKILTTVQELNPVVAPKLEGPLRASRDRASRLKGLIEQSQLEAKRKDASYAPDDGSVGF